VKKDVTNGRKAQSLASHGGAMADNETACAAIAEPASIVNYFNDLLGDRPAGKVAYSLPKSSF
jgi:hypothetical protein